TPSAASGESSRNEEPGSIRRSIRSRTVSFPCCRWRWTYFAPPPSFPTARYLRSSETTACIRSRLVLNVVLFLSTCDSRICIHQSFRNLDFGCQQVLRVGLALRVEQQR